MDFLLWYAARLSHFQKNYMGPLIDTLRVAETASPSNAALNSGRLYMTAWDSFQKDVLRHGRIRGQMLTGQPFTWDGVVLCVEIISFELASFYRASLSGAKAGAWSGERFSRSLLTSYIQPD